MNERIYLKKQIKKARKILTRSPSKAVQERLEFLLGQYRAVDTTPWREPALDLEEMRCSHG